MMLELMFIQSAVLLCSSSKKNHDSSQKSSITASGEAVHESDKKNQGFIRYGTKMKILFRYLTSPY